MSSTVLSAQSKNCRSHLRAVIFDMDGVIVDSHPAHRKAWRQFLRTLGREVSNVELDFILDGRKRSDILRHFLGELSEAETLHYGKRKDEFFQNSSFEVKPLPGVMEFLHQLSSVGIATAIATSASESRTRSTLNRLNLAEYFDVIVSGSDVVRGKPDPAIYCRACQLLNVSPEHSLAIEDAVSGIQSAKAANLVCIGVADRDRSEMLTAAGADHVVENFMGLSPAGLETLLVQSSQKPGHRSNRR
jgi:HAD superfamily hydrolase (TIGR01509 family)